MKFLVVIAFSFIACFAESKLSRVPKVYGVEIAAKQIIRTQFTEGASAGGYLELDYGWQLSGLSGKGASSFLSVPMGYAYFPTEDSGSVQSLFNYGWTVRHQFLPQRVVSPMLGYTLMLSQLKCKEIEGTIIGHQTRFDLGAEFTGREKMHPFVKATYGMMKFPSLYSENRWVHTVGLSVGCRFLRSGKFDVE